MIINHFLQNLTVRTGGGALRAPIIFIVSAIFCISVSASILTPTNKHPAFKMLSKERLLAIKPKHSTASLLSNINNEPSLGDLAETEVHPAAAATLVGIASLDLSELNFLKSKSFGLVKPEFDFSDPQIFLGGQNYSMSVVEIVADEKLNLIYVTARLIDSQGYARFVIDNVSNETVGHFEIGGEIYRMIPREVNTSQQLIYKLDQLELQKVGQTKLSLISQESSSSINRLENELIKTELLLSLAPDYYSEFTKNYIRRVILKGGNLGYIDIKKLEIGELSPQISEVLFDLAVLTRSKKSYSYVITSIKNIEGKVVSVGAKQVIHGVFFDVEINISIRKDGSINQLNATVVDVDSDKLHRPRLTKKEAMDLAKQKLAINSGKDELPPYDGVKFSPYMVYFYDYENYAAQLLWVLLLPDELPKSSERLTYLVILDDKAGELMVKKSKPEGR